MKNTGKDKHKADKHKIEKLYKDLVDMAIAHLTTDAVVKGFLKKLTYFQIEQNKSMSEIKLKDLQLL